LLTRSLMKFLRSLVFVAIVAVFCGAASVQAQVLFSDDFNTAASSANYAQVSFDETAVTHAFDYSALGIPVAPSTTDATTLGIKFEANMTSPGVAAAVTLHTNQVFTGEYTVKFDGWINANGPFPAGGTGSTQFLTAGVGGNGTTVNKAGSGSTGSGGWTAVDGEGQSTIDYRWHKGATLQGVAEGQYAAGTQSGARSAADPYYSQFGLIVADDLPVQGANAPGGFPQQNGTTIAGTFGFAWHEVELVVDPTGGTGGATSVSWFIDDLLIGKLDAGVTTSFPTDGRVTIGYSDPFTSVSDNPTLSFGLIDNLRVESAAPPADDADFDGDGDVDGADFLTWQENLGLTGTATLATGDANDDGNVTGADLAVWQAQFGPGAAVAGASAVPEPTAWWMAVVVALTSLAALPRRRAVGALAPAARRL